MIELCNIEKSYPTKQGRVHVLRDISARIETGESVGILGANGAGKSTLLRIIAGAEHPNFGRVVREGSISWPLGFSGSFSSSLTGAENLRFVCRIFNADIEEVTAFVEDFSELGKAMRQPIRTYSSGMRSRLAFALSMAIDFDVYVIDESLAVGDAAFQAKCEAEFDKRRERSSVLMASHSIDMIKRYCRSAAVLHHGTLRMFETVDEGHEYYQWLTN
jgi:capsular polysaccharide transport system ATP-binding protein